MTPRTTLSNLGIDPNTDDLLYHLKHTNRGNRRRILGTSVKVEKGIKQGVLTSVLYLAAGSRSGFNTCPMAGDCVKVCLGHTTGRLVFESSQRAQVLKTLWFYLFRDDFVATLEREISAKLSQAKRQGKECAIRLNGSSDIIWEKYLDMSKFPEVQFYDYTKWRYNARQNRASNYHLTFSVDEKPQSLMWAVEWLNMDASVAVVVAREGSTNQGDAKQAAREVIRDGFMGYPALDGDESDVRFRDPVGHVVTLYAKGKQALNDTSGFIQRIAN